MTIVVRAEGPEDRAAVRAVHADAFERPNEADLVDALRAAGAGVVSLVATTETLVVGHILFSPVTIEGARGGVGLGPMAVLAALQRRGIGSALVREGLATCARLHHDVVVVLGHPGFYPRFGFAPAAARGLSCEYPVPDDVFMVVELAPGALAGRVGLVRYRPEFAAV